MIIVDNALARREAEGNPVRVAMIGAGFMGRGIALQIAAAVPGMTLVAISNRHIEGARRAYVEAGENEVAVVTTIADLENAIVAGRPAITDDPAIVCGAGPIDALIEVTGTVEFAAEIDGTLGPQLKQYADSAGVVITNADGDQPGVTMNLYRFVKGIGVRPVLCGNIKGLQDPYRNPTTQEAFARRWKQKAHMVTSFADGTKISFEQAIVANATNMRVAKRGMHGPTVDPGTHVRDTMDLYPLDDLLKGPGIVDYVVGAEPGPGVFVLGTHDNPTQQHYLNLYKLGEGPLYAFYAPYHLCHFEVPNTVARAVLFNDAAITPLGAPRVDVVATAKRDLKAGEILDGMGFYMTYGQAENAEVVHRDGLLPMGLAEGCRLKRDMPRDTVLSYEDVITPENRLSNRVREEQNEHFFGTRIQSDTE